MINAVLLEGFLTKKTFNQALQEITSMVSDKYFVQLIIKGEGGDVASAMEFVESVNQLPIGLEIKIYQASSVAAYIALALNSRRREMKKDAVLGIHLGELRISPTQVSPDGKLDGKLLVLLRSYDKALKEVLDKTGISQDKKQMSELYGDEWIRLPAEECFSCGIVDMLF